MREQRVDPPDWPEAIASTDGLQLVVGGPGAGKTEFLVRRAAHLIDGVVSAEELLLLSFSRRGVADLQGRLGHVLQRSHLSVPVMTFHSCASRLLESRGPWAKQPTLLTGPEQVSLVHDLLLTEDPTDWPLAFRSLLGTEGFAGEVTDFLLRCSEQLIDPSRLAGAHRADWQGLPAFLDRYRAELAGRGRIDYGSLLSEAVRTLDDPVVADAVGTQYRYVLVDEFQDTTTAQVGLLRRLAGTTGNLTVAADPYQSIYSFRGADLNNVARFADTFSEGRPVRRLVLTTSFRVPREILAAADRVAAGGALPGTAGRVTPAPGTGSVETYRFAQQSEEAEWLAREVQRLHLEQGYPYASMAIFVRSKRHFLPELSRALERRGIPHDEPDARLADHPAVRVIFDCVIAATSSGVERDRAVRRVLLGRLFELPLGRLREIERARIETGAGWPDVLREMLDGASPLADLIESPEWASRLPAVEGFWRVWTGLPQLTAVVQDPRRSEERAALTSLSQVLGRLFERDAETTLGEYRRLADQEDFEAVPLLSYQAPNADSLTVTTLHQSKGLQFDFVFIADAVEGTFPDLRPRESLLGSRHLNPSVPDDTPGYLRFRLQEEMRLAYTAMTRAGRRVVWTCTSRGFDEGRGMPSRFLPAVAGVETVEEAATRPPERTNPVTTLEAEAWLRRMAGDPAETPAARAAALSVLVEGPTWGLRPWRHFAGTRIRGSDTGLVDNDLPMSPSSVEAYLSCPRRFAFERLLRIGDEPSHYAALGSLLHDVLETAERAAMERRDRHATLAEALERLSQRWNPADFDGPPWADSWLRRAERILTQLYTHWPSGGTPVALEYRLAFEFAGARWRGKADRIEVRGGGLAIVDYKTGASPPTVDEAAESLQLGFYSMAAGADETLAALGEVTAAEMWFPAKKDQRSVPVRSLDLDRISEVEAAMELGVAGIRSEHWIATPSGACDFCAVRLVCPEWPEGREAFSQ